MFARVGRTLLVSVALAAAACGDAAVNPNVAPIGATDVAAIQALVAAVNATVADPTVVSLRGVTVPFRATSPALTRGTASRPASASRPMGARGATASLLGDLDLPARILGGTYTLVGGAFGRDASRPGAPGNGVRVLLYHRIGGVSTDSSVGLLEVVDSLRQATRRVTTAVAGALDGVHVLAVRADVKLVGPPGGAALHDVIEGFVGRGSTPITVLDSFVIDSLSPTSGRNVVVTSIPARNARVLRSTPARPNASASTLRVELSIGGRRVVLEGSRNFATGTHVLAVYVNGADLGRVDTGDLAHFGAAATGPAGERLPQAMRDWLDGVGQLLLVLPAAAELSGAASNLLLALP